MRVPESKFRLRLDPANTADINENKEGGSSFHSDARLLVKSLKLFDVSLSRYYVPAVE